MPGNSQHRGTASTGKQLEQGNSQHRGTASAGEQLVPGNGQRWRNSQCRGTARAGEQNSQRRSWDLPHAPFCSPLPTWLSPFCIHTALLQTPRPVSLRGSGPTAPSERRSRRVSQLRLQTSRSRGERAGRSGRARPWASPCGGSGAGRGALPSWRLFGPMASVFPKAEALAEGSGFLQSPPFRHRLSKAPKTYRQALM